MYFKYECLHLYCIILVMFAARAIPKLCTTVATRSSSSFSGSVVSGPPRVRISFAEKMVLAGVMTTAFLAGPAWVLVHLQEYKGH